MTEVVKAREEADRKAKEAAANIKETPFALLDLQPLWNAYAKRPEVTNSPVISTIMSSCTYELDGNTIKLFLTNVLQKDQLNRLTPKLLKYLRQELANDLIEIEAEIKFTETGQEQGANKLYTDADKLQHLMEEYPLFAELKDFLGLDLG